MIQNAFKSMRGMFSQVDPNNKDSDVSPQDLKLEIPEPTEDERDLVALVKRRFDAASSVKQIHVREWLICQAFRMGNHWVEWRRGELFDLRDPDDNKRNYATIDVIDHLLRKLKARATMSKPDASVKPLTSSPIDKLAAAEARDVLAHYDALFNRQEQSLEWVDSVLSSSTTFLKIIWDPTAKLLGPTTKGIAEYQDLGDIDEIVVPPFEVYPDPSARDWKEVTWLIHAKDRPLSYIQAKYGKRGYLVEGRIQRSDSTNWAEQRLDNISGDSILPSNSDEKVATVYECWELPSPRYPKGRLLRVAGDVLLTEVDQVDWPYQKNDEFPFVPLTYEKRPRGLWSLNAVSRLVKPQMAFNKAVSRMQDRIDNDKVLILEPRGAETGADNDYESPSAMRRVRHEPGFVPQVFQPSPFNEALLAYANFIRGQMEDISGVHEVSNGSVPAGVTAGNAIELLQQSDQTQMSEFVTCIETAQKKRAEWEIALVSQFYSEPRLVAVSQLGSGAAGPLPQPLPIGMGRGASAPQGAVPPAGGFGPLAPNPGGTGPMGMGGPRNAPGRPAPFPNNGVGGPLTPTFGHPSPIGMGEGSEAGVGASGLGGGGGFGGPGGSGGSQVHGMNSAASMGDSPSGTGGRLSPRTGGGAHPTIGFDQAGSGGPMGMVPPPPPPQPGAFGSPDGPGTAALAVRVFEGLTKGGQVRIEVVPGSATPKTPAAQSQQIMDMAAKGFFTPQMLPVLKMVADELGLTRSDTFTDRIDEAYAQIMSNTPPPEVAGQQQMMMAQASAAQQSTMDQQHIASMEALKTHAAIELDTAQTDNKIRLAQATAVAQAHAKAALNAQEHGHVLERQVGDQHHDVAMLSAQRALMSPAADTSPQPPPQVGEQDSRLGLMEGAASPYAGGGGDLGVGEGGQETSP